MFQHIPELVNRFLMPPDSVILHYTIDPGAVPPERPLAFDVEVKTEDGALKNRMAAMLQTSKDTMQEAAKLDEEVCLPSAHIFSLLIPIADCSSHAITAQLTPEAYISAVFRQGPSTIHPDVAGISITRSGEYIGQRAQ